MKKLLSILMIFAFVACSETDNKSKQKDSTPGNEKLTSITLDGISAKVIENTNYYTRIILSKKTDSTHLRSFANALKIKSEIIYFNLPEKPKSGEEFATISYNDIIMIDPELSVDVVKKRMESINSFNGNAYRINAPTIIDELTVFKKEIDFLNEVKKSNDKQIKNMAPALEKSIISMQKREFPAMRKQYAKISQEKLWENDIDVVQSGTTISYIGGYFATNKNKSDTYSSLKSALFDLRFKQVNFKWYKYDDEYTYYTINSPKDSEL